MMTAVPMPEREARTNRTSALEADATPTDATLSLLAGLPVWWAARADAAGLSGDWLDVEWAVAAEAPLLLECPATTLAGMSANAVGEAYAATLATTERARHGRHYTGASLSSELWSMTKRALGWKRPQSLPGLVRDRSCGAAALLLPVLRDHLGAAARIEAQVALAGLPNLIEGIDNDPCAVWLANVLLASEMLPVLARTPRARRKPLPALVRVGDGLAECERPALAEVMNPPYGRVRLEDAERQRFARALYGHANMYGLFMAAAIEALETGGVLSSLVPTSFLAGRYFTNLRSMLVESAPLREIAFVERRSGSFAGVLQETCLASFATKRSLKTTIRSINGHVSEVAKVAAPRASSPWLLPRRSDDAAIAAAALKMTLSLGQSGWQVSTGPLVWNRRRSDLGRNRNDGCVPVVWAADIDGGVIHRDVGRDENRYLQLRRNDADVLVLAEPAVLVQRTTAPEQTRRLICAVMTDTVLEAWGGQVIVENHVNVVRQTSPLASDALIDLRMLGRLLASPTIDRVLRCLSGSVAVSAYELASLPLPSTDEMGCWADLDDPAFERAVAAAYRPAVR